MFLREGVRIQLPVEHFREKYATLGEGIKAERISQLQFELKSLKSKISEYESKLKGHENKISYAKQVLAGIIEAINKLSSEL